MKKSFLLFLGLFCTFVMNAMSFQFNSNDESQKVELKKDEILDNPEHRPRSVIFLEVYYDSSEKTIQLLHEGLGECEVYLVDGLGNVVEQFNICSTIYSSEFLHIYDYHGAYTLVVDSDALYAYGTVYVE